MVLTTLQYFYPDAHQVSGLYAVTDVPVMAVENIDKPLSRLRNRNDISSHILFISIFCNLNVEDVYIIQNPNDLGQYLCLYQTWITISHMRIGSNRVSITLSEISGRNARENTRNSNS